MNFVVENEKDFLSKTWQAVKSKVRPGFVLGLVGDLGVGKTALVKYIAKELGYKGEVTSPTFIMKNSYPISNQGNIKILEHIDLYRLGDNQVENQQEILEWLDCGDGLVIVEWADILSNPDLFDLVVDIKFGANHSRKVRIR